MRKYDIIEIISCIKKLGHLSISLSVLFLTLYLIRGVNVFTNYGRLLVLIGIQLFIILTCQFLLKWLRKN